MIDASVDNIAGWNGVSRSQIIGMTYAINGIKPPEFYLSGITPDNYHDVTTRDKPVSLSHSLGVFSVAAGIDQKKVADVRGEIETYLSMQKTKELCGISVDKILNKVDENPEMTVNNFIHDVVGNIEKSCSVQSANKLAADKSVYRANHF